MLSEMGVVTSISRIHPLTHAQSASLIDKTLDRKKVSNEKIYRVHREHPGPFATFRDNVFTELAQALGFDGNDPSEYWTQAESFLGYPPVLLALAERLAVDNPKSEKGITNLAGSSSTAVTRGRLLRQIVEGILDRESEKVRPRIAKALGLPDDKATVLYGREEQTLRILRVILDGKFEVVYPAILDSDERIAYEDQIESFVNDHPFLIGRKFSNAVFGDYLRAFVVTSETIDVVGIGKEQLLSQCAPEGPFYAHFLFDLSPQVRLPEMSITIAEIVDESLVDGIIRSHLLAASGTSTVTYYSEGNNAAMLTVVDMPENATLSAGYSMSFGIREPVGILELTAPLSNCMISANAAVTISSPAGSVQLGPSVMLITRELQIEGEHIIATAGPDDEGVMIFARDEASHDPHLKVAAYPADCLTAHWPNMWYQWSSYSMEFPQLGAYIDSQAAYQVLFWIRRVLTSMKGSTKEAPSVFGELLDKLIIGTNPIARATLEALIEVGVVMREKTYYRLQLDKLKEFKVNYAALRDHDFAKALELLQKRIVKTDAILSVLSRPA